MRFELAHSRSGLCARHATARPYLLGDEPHRLLIADHTGGRPDVRRTWLNARVDRREGLAEVRTLFAKELRLLDGVDEDAESWERAYEAVRNTVTLRYPDGQEVPEFLLHIDGNEAWWRWSDEPFSEEQ
ncbi:hypothetical protein [Micromonospora sp. M51]|uniref:hypothetical protein n=1 Tax=Micromonospora sp. M51 TaxID=2824889 RepID=UPI001FFD102B|nr:hypothetical protein [Micromonospora sp. M51]